jgi:hypothetical protein
MWDGHSRQDDRWQAWHVHRHAGVVLGRTSAYKQGCRTPEQLQLCVPNSNLEPAAAVIVCLPGTAAMWLATYWRCRRACHAAVCTYASLSLACGAALYMYLRCIYMVRGSSCGIIAADQSHEELSCLFELNIFLRLADCVGVSRGRLLVSGGHQCFKQGTAWHSGPTLLVACCTQHYALHL